MELTKKDIAIILLIFSCLVSGGLNLYFSRLLSYVSGIPHHETLNIGTESGPHDIDPTDSWDSASNNVIEQVIETLFTYDTRQFVIDETMPRENWLAMGYSWDSTYTVLTIDIRTGVKFHDGTQMDAHAVAWSFNRFRYLMNHTGELPADRRAVKVHSLYEFPDGTPIIQSVVAMDSDTVLFTLNAPYGPILDAMCYISCGILSPASTPATEIIDIGTGDIVGTGPYMYDYYITDVEVRFSKFNDYWGFNVVEDDVMFDWMVYSVIEDQFTLNNAILARDIDILLNPIEELFLTFKTNPWIKVHEVIKPGVEYNYLGFNTKIINLTWRKAMTYAINYTYIIEDLLEGRAHRAYSAISPSYVAGFNHWLRDADRKISSTNGSAFYNLTLARAIILTDLAGDSRLDSRLQANDTKNDPLWLRVNLASFNFTYKTWDLFRSQLFLLLEDWFDDIGVTVIDGGSDWFWPPDYWYWYVPGGFDNLEIYFAWWDPSYLDPFNMLDPLFSNISVSNACQINDAWVMGNLSLALETIDDTERNKIYHEIQWRLFAELYVHAPIYHNIITYVHAADLYDVAYNPLGRWWALPIKRNLTWVPVI